MEMTSEDILFYIIFIILGLSGFFLGKWIGNNINKKDNKTTDKNCPSCSISCPSCNKNNPVYKIINNNQSFPVNSLPPNTSSSWAFHNLCLDTEKWGATPSPSLLSNCSDTTSSQEFKLLPLQNDRFQIYSVPLQKCLDGTNSSWTWTDCDENNINQKFLLNPSSFNFSSIVFQKDTLPSTPAPTNLCLDVSSLSNKNSFCDTNTNVFNKEFNLLFNEI